MTEWNVSEKAAALHSEALVLDMTMPWLNYLPLDQQVEPLGRMAASGYTFVSLTLAVDSNGLNDTMHIIAKERAYFLANADKYVLVETVDDIRRAKQEKKLALGFHFQGTNPVSSDLNMVETYYKLGVRHMLMAYNRHFPANLQIHGNRIYIAPPRELHSLPSPPMTRLWRADHVRKAIWQRFPPSRHTSPVFSTLPSISSAYAGTELRRRSSIKAKIFWNKIFDTATSASWNVT